MTDNDIVNSTRTMVNSSGGVIMTGEELKYYRLRAKITQKRLGIMLGYKETTAEKVVQQWEYNRQPIPLKHFRGIAKALNIPLEKLIP